MENQKKLLVEKKDEIKKILIDMWTNFGIDTPNNYEDIVQYCYKNVCETAHPIHWSNIDVVIAFRRWIEDQADKECTENN